MYRCLACGNEFADPVRYSDGVTLRGVCPTCTSGTLEEGEWCERCGDHIAGVFNLCEECETEAKGVFLRFYTELKKQFFDPLDCMDLATSMNWADEWNQGRQDNEKE